MKNDNAPVLQMKTKEKFFSFVVKTDFTQSHQRFDQCGIVMYLDIARLMKGFLKRVLYFPSLYSSGVMAVRRLKYLEKKAGLGKLRSSEI